MLQATPDTISGILAAATGGFTVELSGIFPLIKIPTNYTNRITIIAHRATVHGVSVSGSNIDWFGGQIEAPNGNDGVAAGGYGIAYGATARDVRWIGCKLRNANRGVAGSGGLRLSWIDCDFAVRQDGLIIAGGEGFQIVGNRFHDFTPKPTTCTLPNGDIQYGLGSKSCVSLGGVWRDGDHSDAIQLRNGCKNFLIAYNKIESISQGIGQMDSVTDAPLDDIQIIGNEVEVTGFHSITIGQNSTNISVIGNRTKQMTGRRSPLRLPVGAIVQDNEVLSP